MNQVVTFPTCNALIEPFQSRYRTAPFAMHISPAGLAQIKQSVGRYRPETGGLLLGPTDKLGVDLFEFDHHGSAQAGATMYAPHTAWCNERMEYHLSHPQNPKFLHGFLHSHPGGFGEPSQAVGDGLGDLGFAAKFFEENEAPLWFFMPIGTFDKHGRFFISPFIVHRDWPHHPFIAPDIKICEADRFPKAQYNPAFLERIGQASQPTSSGQASQLVNLWTWQHRHRYWARVNRRRNNFGL